jgi:hypothetical protein
MKTVRSDLSLQSMFMSASMSREEYRRDLAQRLMVEFPTLPAAFILGAVAEAANALTLCGDGELERELAERTARHNLTAVLESLRARRDMPLD